MSAAPRPAFLFLAANTPWVYALAQSLERYAGVTAVRLIDWLNNARLKPQWPETQSAVRRRAVTMPPGYARTLEPLLRPLMRALVDREREALRRSTGTEPYVVCTYPYIAPWVRQVASDRLVYYNLDDYSLYDTRRAARTRVLEDEMIGRARRTACLSMHQVESFRARSPGAADRVTHFPLGVNAAFINPDPGSGAVTRAVGYVGNLTERVDWPFVRRVVEAMPDVRFHFVGNRNDGLSGANVKHDPEWSVHRTHVLALPNVVAEGPVRQADVPQHYWKYALNWMPYDPRNRFNIASCPTKIMDALASGRPFLSTDIPESRLYPDHVRVVCDGSGAVAGIRAILDGAVPHDARSQVSFAKMQTWDHRATRLLELLKTA